MKIENYKEDWPRAQERMKAWWKGELLDRVALQVRAPKEGEEKEEVPSPETVEKRWLDYDYRMKKWKQDLKTTFWGGEAFPLFGPNLGPDVFASFFGAELEFPDDQTSWVSPIIDSWEERPELELDRDNYWWRKQVELVERAMEEGGNEGKWITGIPDTHSGADALAALRGRNDLSVDLYRNPEEVRQAMDELERAVLEIYEEYFSLVEPQRWGSSSGWLPAWNEGKTNVVQADYIALISPEMTEEFFLESIVAEARWLDHAVFHLDGPDAVDKLDLLLDVPDIEAVQWVPGAGNHPMTDWLPLLKRVQEAGKSLHLSLESVRADGSGSSYPGEAEAPLYPNYDVAEKLIKELEPGGLMLNTYCSFEEDARQLLEKVEEWTDKYC